MNISMMAWTCTLLALYSEQTEFKVWIFSNLIFRNTTVVKLSYKVLRGEPQILQEARWTSETGQVLLNFFENKQRKEFFNIVLIFKS